MIRVLLIATVITAISYLLIGYVAAHQLAHLQDALFGPMLDHLGETSG